MVIGQLTRLFGNRLGDLLAAIADVDAIKPGKGIEQPVAVAVFDEHTLAACDDAIRRLTARMLRQMAGGVKKAVAVPAVQLIVRQHVRRPDDWIESSKRH